MPVCDRCGGDLKLYETTCPGCQGSAAAGEPWVAIAQLTSLAEAGFFADVLAEEGMESRVIEDNGFSAINGQWDHQYLIQVREADAATAAHFLQAELDSNLPEEAEPPNELFGQTHHQISAEGESLSLLAWKPLLFAALAGGVAFCLTRGGWEVVGGRQPQRVPLWQALENLETPLSTKPGQGRRQVRLQYDPAANLLELEEDRDGDGHFDSFRYFRHGQEVILPEAE